MWTLIRLLGGIEGVVGLGVGEVDQEGGAGVEEAMEGEEKGMSGVGWSIARIRVAGIRLLLIFGMGGGIIGRRMGGMSGVYDFWLFGSKLKPVRTEQNRIESAMRRTLSLRRGEKG